MLRGRQFQVHAAAADKMMKSDNRPLHLTAQPRAPRAAAVAARYCSTYSLSGSRRAE